MPIVKTVPWDASEHLDSAEAIAGYLEAAFEIGDPQLVIAALGDVARARGMSSIAKDTGLSRESLYRSLAKGGNPEFTTVMKVVKALGVRIEATTVRASRTTKRSLTAKAPAKARATKKARVRTSDQHKRARALG
jgi:probable addiction module antidote protein